jgi:hypothetical protein
LPVQSDALRTRVQALASLLDPTAGLRAPSGGEPAGAADADLHAALTGVTDLLLERVASATAILQAGDGGLDDGDRLAARLLLADLSLVVRAWQVMRGVAIQRLDGSAADLAAARRTLDRALAMSDRAGDILSD